MTCQSVIGRSLELVDPRAVKAPDVSSLSPKPTFGGSCPGEIIDAPELARRWNVPASWVRSHTRGRTRDELPCIRLGKYVRFRWGSPELEAWLSDHQEAR